jgi:hypothetical protein
MLVEAHIIDKAINILLLVESFLLMLLFEKKVVIGIDHL